MKTRLHPKSQTGPCRKFLSIACYIRGPRRNNTLEQKIRERSAEDREPGEQSKQLQALPEAQPKESASSTSKPDSTSALSPPLAASPPSVPFLQGLQELALADARSYDAGIYNLGNTCFFNALLTCLSSAAPFADRLVRHLRHHSHQGGNARCLRCRLAGDLLLLCEEGRTEPFAPDTVRTLQDWAPLFRFGDQQCAGEAARLLLDALDTEDFNSVAHLVTPARALAVRRTALAAEHFRV